MERDLDLPAFLTYLSTLHHSVKKSQVSNAHNCIIHTMLLISLTNLSCPQFQRVVV